MVALHHQRKAGSGSEREVSIDSLYASTWLTSGLGSVLLITGDPGDVHVEVHHVKQPAEVVGPITTRHDHATGTTTFHHAPTVLEVVTYALAPVTAREVARLTYGDTTPRAVKRAQRALKDLEGDGLVVRVAGSVGPGGRTLGSPRSPRRGRRDTDE
jgi:replicative DNA helicase